MNRPSDPISGSSPTAAIPHPGLGVGPVGVRRARLGELDAGVVAIAGPGGVASFAGSGTRVSWWVGAEDRWHRPEAEPSTRDRLVEGTPVVESSVRIPSGNAIGRVAVARVGGVARPSVVFDVENSSPIPVAFAYVVESSERIELTDDGIDVDGVGRLVLTRPALGYAASATAADLLTVLEAGTMTPDRPVWGRPGAVAVLVPLPHTAHAVATFTPGAQTADVSALADRGSVPAPERIVAGWATHLTGTPRLELDPFHRAAFLAAECDVMLGYDDAAAPTSGADVALTLGLLAEASGRMGRTDDPSALVDLLERQRANGSIAAADPVAATLQLLRACSAWWAGGADRSFCELYLGPMADAVRWLDKRKRRDAVASAIGARGALLGAAATFAELGEPDVAAAVGAAADRLGASAPELPTAAGLLERLADGLAWTEVPADGSDSAPDVGASARFVVATTNEAVRDDGDALAILAGRDVRLAGQPFEAHDLPTRAGLLSYGLRWHGERPALLWEITPWPDRPAATAVTLTAPALDPAWSATSAVGEALLAAPAGASRIIADNAERAEAAARLLPDDPTQQPFQAFHHDNTPDAPVVPSPSDDPLPPGGSFS